MRLGIRKSSFAAFLELELKRRRPRCSRLAERRAKMQKQRRNESREAPSVLMSRGPEVCARGVPPPDLAAAKAVYRRRGGRRDNRHERRISREVSGIRTSRLARWSGGGHLSTRCDGAASYLGIATPNQRRINATVQSIAAMLASFDMGHGVEETKLDLVRMPGL